MNLWVLSDCTKTVFFWMGFFKQNGSKKTSPNGDQFLWSVDLTKGKAEKKSYRNNLSHEPHSSLDASYGVKNEKLQKISPRSPAETKKKG